MSRSVKPEYPPYDKHRYPEDTSCAVAPLCDSEEPCSLNAYHAGDHEWFGTDAEEIEFQVGPGFVIE
jgi:hypothetical protein